jgi:hypothetical protein
MAGSSAPRYEDHAPIAQTVDRLQDFFKSKKSQREAVERLTDSDPFPARFHGTCAECDGVVRPGDEILRRADGDYVHAITETCSELTPAAIGKHEALCGRCFCYHAGECA